MKKTMLFVLCLLFLFIPFGEQVYAQSPQTFVVVFSKTNVYELPSFSAKKIAVLEKNDEIEVEFEEENPKKYTSDDGFDFFKLTSQDGYIFCDSVVLSREHIQNFPNFNAKTNKDCDVFTLEDGEFVKSEISLKKGTQIFLYKGFGNDEFIPVEFAYNNKIVYAYLQKKCISPNGINPVIITCICLILAVTGIIFAFVFMKKKKN